MWSRPGGCLQGDLYEERLWQPHARHSQVQAALPDPLQGTAEHLSQAGGTSGKLHFNKCWIEEERTKSEKHQKKHPGRGKEGAPVTGVDSPCNPWRRLQWSSLPPAAHRGAWLSRHLHCSPWSKTGGYSWRNCGSWKNLARAGKQCEGRSIREKLLCAECNPCWGGESCCFNVCLGFSLPKSILVSNKLIFPKSGLLCLY